jgi:hypothetical protein
MSWLVKKLSSRRNTFYTQLIQIENSSAHLDQGRPE